MQNVNITKDTNSPISGKIYNDREQKKVAFYTLGCKLNFSETSTIARNFQDEGFDRVEFEEVADIYVINTCSVTENADKQFKQVVKKR